MACRGVAKGEDRSRSDTTTLGTLVHFRHFSHFKHSVSDSPSMGKINTMSLGCGFFTSLPYRRYASCIL